VSNIPSTKASSIAFVGPQVDRWPLWRAETRLAYSGPDTRPVIFKRMGLTTLLEESVAVPVEVWPNDVQQWVQVRPPSLMQAYPAGGEGTLNLLRDTEGRTLSGKLLAEISETPSPVVVTPLGEGWPDQDRDPWGDHEKWMMLPHLRVVEGRVAARLAVDGSPLAKFLGLDGPRREILGGVKVEMVDGGRVWPIELTSAGIEFKAWLPDPSYDFAPAGDGLIEVWVCLESPAPGVFRLRLLAAADQQALNEMQERLARALGDLGTTGTPASVRFDARFAVPEFAWPLKVAGQVAKLEGKFVAAQTPSWTEWRVDFGKDAFDLRVAATSVTQSSVVSVAVRTVRLSRSETGPRVTLQFNESPADAGKLEPLGPQAGVQFTYDTPAWKAWPQFNNGAAAKVSIDLDEPYERLQRIYVEGHALAKGDPVPHVFVAVRDGWLQAPVPIKVEAKPGVPAREVPDWCAPMSGQLVTRADHGGLVSLEAAAHAKATIAWVVQQGAMRPQEVSLHTWGTEGRLRGYLFIAETSPTAEEAVPSLIGGPAATRDLPLDFGSPRDAGRFRNAEFAVTANAWSVKFPIAGNEGPCIAWVRHPTRPLISVMPLTRSARNAMRPSPSRDLLPLRLKGTPGKDVLEFAGEKGQPLPQLKFAGSVEWANVPEPMSHMTLPSLQGVEFRPRLQQATPSPLSLAALGWQGQLRYGLPLLDELFANTELPRRGGTSTKPAEQIVATALRPEELQQAWLRNLDRLQLTWTQDRAATPWIDADRKVTDTEVEGLLPPYKWTAAFRISLNDRVSLPGFATPVAFGSYSLAGREYGLELALPGLGTTGDATTFSIQAGALRQEAGPIRITGMAAAGYAAGSVDMDSRGFGLARSAQRMNGISVRQARRDDGTSSDEFALLTSMQPLSVPRTALSLPLALAVRDLPVSVQQAGRMTSYAFDGRFHPVESAPGSNGQAFEREAFGHSLHEWRLFEMDPDSSRRYDIAWGPLAFTPLRLWKLEVGYGASGPSLQSLEVLGRMSLATFAGPWQPGTDANAAPFAPEELYASGDLFLLKVYQGAVSMVAVEVTEKKDKPGTLSETTKMPGTAAIALHARLARLGGTGPGPGGDHPVRLDLEPRLHGSATLRARLFGSDRMFTGAVTRFSSEELEVSFTPPAAAHANTTSLARATRIVLQVTAEGAPQKRWRAELAIGLEVALRNEHGDVLFHFEDAGACQWLNLMDMRERPGSYALDHTAGRFTLALERAGDDSASEPLQGFRAQRFSARGILAMAFPHSEGWPAFDGGTPTHFEMEGEGELGSGAPDRIVLKHVYSGPSVEGGSAPLRPGSHAITLDWSAQHTSVIRWPTVVVVSPDNASADVAQGDVRKWSRLVEIPAANPLFHHTSLRLQQHVLPAGCVGSLGGSTGIARPWSVLATVEHRIERDGKTMRWHALDRLAIMPAAALWQAHAQVANPDMHAFAPRYTFGAYRADKTGWTEVPHAGVALLPWAQSGFTDPHLAGALASLQGRPEPVIAGASATLFELSATAASPQGAVAVVPWLAAIGIHDALATMHLDQCGAVPRTWRFAMVDAIAASAPTGSQRRSTAVAFAWGTEQARIDRALTVGAKDEAFAKRAAAQLPVSQAWFEPFDVRSGKPTRLDASINVKEVPYFPQAMLVLSELWAQQVKQAVTTNLLVSGDAEGAMVRVSVAAAVPAQPAHGKPANAAKELVVQPVDLVALDARHVLVMDRALAMPAMAGEDALEAQGDVRSRAHIRDLVARHVPQSVAIIARARSEAGVTSWLPIEPGRQFGDVATSHTVLDNNMLPPSPALGWPSATQVELAAKMTAVLGPEEPLVSAEAGLAGRGHTVRLPAWAPPVKGGPEALYVSVVAHVAFQRAKQVAYRGPAARHLAVVPTRLRAPLQSATAVVLRRLIGGTDDGTGHPVLPALPVAPISPPRLERTSVGHRPGEMHLWGLSMVIPAENEAFDATQPGYGRPATSGPIIAHQHRTPRSPALPRDEGADWAATMIALKDRTPRSSAPNLDKGAVWDLIKRYRRRTLVSQTDLDANGRLAEMLLLSGHGTALRKQHMEKERHQEYRYTLAPAEGQAFLGEDWNGALTLRVGGTPNPPSAPGDPGAKVMLEHGLLPYPGARTRAALRIGDLAFPFTEWRADFAGGVNLTFGMGAGDAKKVVQQLLATTVDVPVALELQILAATGKPEPTTDAQPLAPWSASTLQEGPPENMRLPLLRAAGERPTLAVRVATAIFGDPAYDRQLGSPCATSDAALTSGGRKLQLALDREEYNLTDTAQFAGGFRSVAGFDAAGETMYFHVDVQPKALPDGTTPSLRTLVIPWLDGEGKLNHEKVELKNPEAARALKLNGMLEADQRTPAQLEAGDQLHFHLAYERWTASVSVRLTETPSIAPPPAVYSVVTASDDWSASRVCLHACAPLPDRLEYPELAADLARGFVQRRALFIWSWPLVGTEILHATLIKVDRSGGAQLPGDQQSFART
jgi:hypothetical protein